MFSLADALFQVIVLGLVILFVVSFTLFIRRLLVNQQVKNSQLNELEKKLDKIIGLMEKEKSDSLLRK